MLVFGFPGALPGAAQSTTEGSWTGGFWLEGNWVAVKHRREREKLSGWFLEDENRLAAQASEYFKIMMWD